MTTIYGIFWGKYVYIGQTDGDPELRRRKHQSELANRRHSCELLQQIYNFYADELTFTVLEQNADIEAERSYIQAAGKNALNTIHNSNRQRDYHQPRGEVFSLYDDVGDLLWRGQGVAAAVRATGWSRSKVHYRKVFDA